jgi:hypothetical protein
MQGDGDGDGDGDTVASGDDVELLVDAALSGDCAERARLLTYAATGRSADKAGFDELLDGIASRAAAGSEPAAAPGIAGCAALGLGNPKSHAVAAVRVFC